MKVLVTGADGFVGGWLIRELLHHGHHVVGAVRVGASQPALLTEQERLRVDWIDFDLLAAESMVALATCRAEAVIHLAAVASGADARQDPGYAWNANAAGTARLVEAIGRSKAAGASDPLLVVVSTGEVYGAGPGRPLTETDPVHPRSPYAASKWGAEIAARECADRAGLRLVIARAFPHTGPGQHQKYVVPALAARLRTAKRVSAPVIKTGNLDPIRDLLDVRDVARAYRLLLEHGSPGQVYNVASGVGTRLADVVDRLMDFLAYRVILESDPALRRENDLPYLVGDPTRIQRDLGWMPTIALDQTLKELLDAQAD